ncbi:MAG: DUF3320 domain-containing protein [Candidatus Xenobia bacterium]
METCVGQALEVEVTFSPTINLAMQQNSVPVVRGVAIHNRSETVATDLAVRISLQPKLLSSWEQRIELLDAGGTFHVSTVNLALPVQELTSITEREAGELHVELTQQGKRVLEQVHPIEVLAFNEWNGTTALPEILAAFSQPNDSAIDPILRAAAGHLRERTQNGALSGYQGNDPKRVLLTAAALYSAIQDLGIEYLTVPASFEKRGQKIRTPSQIVTNRVGNCLDLSLLFAACFEQAGLHPILVLVDGHAFPGVWLCDANFPEPATDDPLRLLKRVEIGELCFLEATALTQGVPFDRAHEMIQQHLTDAAKFRYAVDVKAARNRRILPLSQRLGDSAPSAEAPRPRTASQSDVEVEIPQPSVVPPPRQSGPARLERWKTKLLDLSLRNTLLNYRETRKTVALITPDLKALVDTLTDGGNLDIHPKTDLMSGNDPRDAAVYAARNQEDPLKAFLMAEQASGRLRTPFPPAELQTRLLDVWRTSRLSIEESGANTLYLAVGFLCWYEREDSETQRMAPLVLMPIRLDRGVANEAYRMRQSEEELRVNITLLEKLQKDYNLDTRDLRELPDPLDIAGFLQRFRRKIVNIDRWHVIEEAHIGHFSFTKFLMWLDLQMRTDALAQNVVVRHLLDGGERPFPLVGPFPKPREVDRHAPAEYFGMLDADSSQIAAVYAAEAGQSFVLEGPPGTGKSQTITNLIAHNLARGRSVLFVSQKMAALSVVHKRLQDVGLAPFCLELHSNKASKTEVLKQLGESLQVGAHAPREGWEAFGQRLQVLRDDLNHYVEVLHAPHPLGESVFEVTSKLVGLRQYKPLALGLKNASALTEQQIRDWREALKRTEGAANTVGSPQEHPWRAASLSDWGHSAEQSIAAKIAFVEEAARQLQTAVAACCEVLETPLVSGSEEELKVLAAVARSLVASPTPAPELLQPTGWDDRHAQVSRFMEHGRRRNQLWNELSAHWQPALLGLDLASLHTRFAEATRQNALVAWFKLFGARRTLARVGQLGANAQVLKDLELAVAVQEEDGYLASVQEDASKLLRRVWDQAATPWDQVGTLVDWVETFRKQLFQLLDRHPQHGADRWPHLATLASNASERLAADQPAGIKVRVFLDNFTRFQELRDSLASELKLEPVVAWGTLEEPAHLDKVLQCLGIWQSRLSTLRDWCHYVRTLETLEQSGLQAMARAHRNGEIRTDDLVTVFDRSMYEEWLGQVSDAEPVLRRFHSAEHTRTNEAFRETDRESFRLARSVVVSRFAAQLGYTGEDAPASSEMGILQREIKKKRSQLAMRKLFERIPTLLRRLKPCFLMSPLSVAQYLSPEFPPFDLVVFDEASQIPVWDAIGAIGRAKQAIVVGDPKQLPPTSFFSRMDGEGLGEEDDLEELESILDECIASSLPNHSLIWHYRSRHEDLITFSNYHYYDGRLLTFPSPESRGGVSHVPVPQGVYDRSGSRTNRAEADAVVAEIVRRLKDPEQRKRSIGVVTFSQAQQTLVEDLLDKARRESVEIEPYCTNTVNEPVFVKNLENVQGDERDVVLFSIGYGPDAAGKVSINFGPLNRDGGERRLNVAVTRARQQMIVFSTLRPDQIDLTKTSARGVHQLRVFLEYAMRGPAAIREKVSVNGDAECESPFEADVAQVLEEHGFVVHRQVGCSGYRIDLAVVDGGGRYRLGIECDGATYHSAKSARDRDRLRQGVLEQLGWRLYRIWSSDWWHNREREVEKLLAAVEEAGRTVVEPQAVLEEKAQPAVHVEEERPEPVYQSLPVMQAVQRQDEVYRYFSVTVIGTLETFEQPSSSWTIREKVRDVLKVEAPISCDELVRRVAACWGIHRAGSRVKERVLRTVSEAGGVRRGDFVWPADQSPATWRAFRVPGDKARDASDIPPEEIANAAAEVLRVAVSLSVEDLAKESARLLGYNRAGKNVVAAMEEGVKCLERQGRCKLDGTRVYCETGAA